MATGTLAACFAQQYSDDNGVPLAGGKVYVYAAGTTTPTTTYSDVGLTVANTNPVILDAGGRCVIYLDAGSYKFHVTTSADVVVWTQDNVAAVPTSQPNLELTGTSGEALAVNDVVYLSDGSGSRTAGRWYRADADTVYMSSSATTIGMATAAVSSGASVVLRLRGVVTGLSGLTAGALYYVSATAGALAATEPQRRRLVGQAISTTALLLLPGDRSDLLALAGNDTEPAVSAADTGRVYINQATNELRASIDGGPYVVIPAVVPATNHGLLTLTSGTPVTTADVTAATSVYYTPASGDRVTLYDGTRWRLYTFTERTLSLSGLAALTNYDVFLYDNAGTLTLESVAWTNATTRATAVTTQDGVTVKSGATTRRYLGTVRTTGTVGQAEDSLAKRFLFNHELRGPRAVRRQEATNSWSYGTTTLRQANASALNQVEMVVGRSDIPIDLLLVVACGSANSSTYAKVAIGEDSTTTAATGGVQGFVRQDVTGGNVTTLTAAYRGYVPLGYHYYTWLEAADATYDFYGDNGGPSGLSPQSGLVGWVGR